MAAADSTSNAAARGLTSAEAQERLRLDGPNEIAREAPPSRLRVLARQFMNPLVALLAGAAIVSQIVGGLADAIAILAILVVNGLVGYLQEEKAARAMSALRSLTAPRARVMRDGRTVQVPAAEVVRGDLLVLEGGDVIAADALLVEANALRTREAALTGESEPVDKIVGEVALDAPLAERSNAVFMGTSVAAGTGLAIVQATGMATQVGRIAQLLETATSGPTPLQARLARLGRLLSLACLGVVGLVMIAGLARGDSFLEVLLSAVALAVAAVPEGLPAVVTIALAIGVERLASRKVLVRRLPAVETLGAVTLICTDKTGTLTTGVMALRETWGPDRAALLEAAAACVDAELSMDDLTGTGDPTEIAILVAAARSDIRREAIEAANRRVHERPFDPATRSMAILRRDGRVFVKGAVEVLLPSCVGAENAQLAATDMASRGLRVLAVAIGHGVEERDLRLVGLLGLADPPRTEAIEAVAVARTAGIATIMITGDHPVTAAAIAREMGIATTPDDATRFVHARATPEDKLRIVRDAKQRGAIVAMTGDGVNDAPALQEAHVGIAMGIAGTEVTREAADIVLADDNFASIVAGVREGRGVQENIRKAVVYLLGGNVGELAVMGGAALLGMPLPLLPLHLLWINLVTDGLPALALVVDPADEQLMTRPPDAPSRPLLGRREWAAVAVTGALTALVTLATFAWALPRRGIVDARDLAFSVLVMSELFRAFAARDAARVYWQTQPLRNLRLVAVVTLSAGLQVAIHHVEPMRQLLRLGHLTLGDCAQVVLVGLVPVTVLELLKVAATLGTHGQVATNRRAE